MEKEKDEVIEVIGIEKSEALQKEGYTLTNVQNIVFVESGASKGDIQKGRTDKVYTFIKPKEGTKENEIQ